MNNLLELIVILFCLASATVSGIAVGIAWTTRKFIQAQHEQRPRTKP